MKCLFVCLWLFCLVACLPVNVYAQNVPKNPNKIDKKGLRQGAWTITYNKDWKEIAIKDSIVFYRLITYKDDKPVGKVTDNYLSGKVQMEATLLADRPTEVFEGVATWYREDGTKETERVFNNGEAKSEKNFDAKGIEITKKWKEVYAESNVYWEKQDYANAVIYYEQALILAEKEFGKENENYLATIIYVAFCYKKLQNFQKTEKAYLEVKNIYKIVVNKEDEIYATLCNGLANLYYEKKLYAQAEPLYIETKNIREKILGKEHLDYATSCNDLALLYYNQYLYAKAEPLYIEAKDIRERVLGTAHVDYATSCNDLALLYYNQYLYAKAEPLYIEAKEIYKKVLGKEHNAYATSCFNLAGLYKNQELYAKAEPLYIEAKNIKEKVLGKEHPDYAICCNSLATLYDDKELYEKAELLYIEAKNIQEKVLGKEHPDYATSCNNLAYSYKNQGLYTKAEPLYIEAKNIREKVLGKEHPDYALSCNNLAALYKDQSVYIKAELLYIEAKNIQEKVLGKKHPDYALSCNNLASLYESQGLYAKAELLYIEDKHITEKILGKEHSNYARSCNNLAGLYESQGLYSKAEPLYMEAKNTFEKALSKEHTNYALSCNNLANLYSSQGLYAKALPLYVEAKSIREKVLGKAHPDYANSCGNLASFYYSQGLYAEAEPLHIEAKSIREKVLGKEHPDYATSCNNLATLYENQGLYTQAEPLYIEAKSIREKVLGKQHPSYALSCNNLALLYQRQDLYAQAELLYIEAKNIQEKTIGKEHPDYVTSCSNLSLLYNHQGLYAKAEPLYIEINQALLTQIDRNFSNLSEKEKGNYYSTFNYVFEAFNSFVVKRYKENLAITIEVYNNTLATKALLFDASNKMRARINESNDEQLKTLFQKWKDKKEYLNKVYSMSIIDKQKQGIEIGKLETEVNQIEKELSTKSEVFAKVVDKKRYVWTDVQKMLKAGEAAIEIIRFKKYDNGWIDSVRYMALIVTPTSKYPEMIILNNGNELEGKYANNYQNCIKGKATDKYSYMQYWSSISEKLQGVKKVYLSVDGVYNSINLYTLKNPTTGKYVSEEVKIQLVSNTKDIVLPTALSAKEKEKNGAVLIGFPDYNNKRKAPKSPSLEDKKVVVDSTQRFFDGGNISELVGTKMEVENIAKMLQKAKIVTQSYTEGQASEEVVKNLDSPYILHIATHGFFMKDVEKNKKDERGLMGMDSKTVFENPLLRAGLLFANAKEALQDGGDGVLTAYEAMNLNLDNTDLVVMSACETGLGEVRNGEGVYGLQRAFQTAGAKTILMSLWTVSDDATQQLMTLFYENLIVKKQGKREAFQNAQNELKKSFPEPYYWGAFVMVGE